VESFGGGVFFAISQIANKQIEFGDQVIVVYSKRWDTPKNINKYFNEKIQLIEISFSLKPKKFIKHVIKCYNVIKNSNLDVLHLHSSYSGFIGRILFSRKAFKIFYTPHGLSILRLDLSKIHRLILLVLEKIAHFLSGYVIACSESESDAYKKYISNSKISFLNNSIPLDKLKKYNINPNINKKTFIMVGRIMPQKNPNLFIEIKKQLELSGINAEYIWIGDGDIALKKNLVENNIKVTGILNRELVWEEMSKSFIFIQTSLWEGMPLTLMESQAIGLPIISNNTPGNTSVINHGETGYLYSDVNNAVELIKKLINFDNSIWLSISNKAKAYAQDNYSVSNYCMKLNKIYQNIKES
tara:strand:- start:178 stop:1245 length:1068 start_codon:yes stop_codon:yes gene_type:complete